MCPVLRVNLALEPEGHSWNPGSCACVATPSSAPTERDSARPPERLPWDSGSNTQRGTRDLLSGSFSYLRNGCSAPSPPPCGAALKTAGAQSGLCWLQAFLTPRRLRLPAPPLSPSLGRADRSPGGPPAPPPPDSRPSPFMTAQGQRGEGKHTVI